MRRIVSSRQDSDQTLIRKGARATPVLQRQYGAAVLLFFTSLYCLVVMGYVVGLAVSRAEAKKPERFADRRSQPVNRTFRNRLYNESQLPRRTIRQSGSRRDRIRWFGLRPGAVRA